MRSDCARNMQEGTCLTKRIRIRRHVSKNDEDVLLELVSVVFRCGEGQTRCDDTLDRRVVCKVEEEGDTIQTAILFEVLLEEPRSLHVDTHGGEHD